jgi:hypothetical protein
MNHRPITARTLRSLTQLLCCLGVAASCSSSTNSSPEIPGQLAQGTWGTNGAGVVVGESLVHVHFNCTLGDFPRPESLDGDGRFNLAGSYVLRAFPVQLGPSLPARFSGVVRGNRLTLSVAIDDTVEKRLVALGPTTITLGRDPVMGPCPICVKPKSW